MIQLMSNDDFFAKCLAAIEEGKAARADRERLNQAGNTGDRELH
jgi:hypothetical protein